MLRKSQHEFSYTGQLVPHGVCWIGSAHILPGAGQTFWAAPAVRSWWWPHKQEFCCWSASRMPPQYFKKKKKIRRFCIPESGADDSRQAPSPKKLSFRLRLTAFSPLPSGTSNAGRQRKAHPPENLARHQECIFMYFMFASFYLRSISNTFS